MKTLITGGAGFIGSHLAECLIKEGIQVVVIDNFSTGRSANLEPLYRSPHLEIQEANICDAERIQPLFQNVDWVFHLAALADIVPSVQHPMDYHRTNVDGTFTVLEAARRANVRRFVYAASSSCYGVPDHYPTSETAEIRPKYPYALTKYVGERYAMHWHEVYGLPVASLRFFNVYGPRSRTSGTYGAVFGVFLAQKLHNKPFTLVGDGTQTRDFTFVTDVVRACLAAARSSAAGEIFNVGSGKTYSVNRLVELLGGGPVTHIPKRPGEPDCTLADIGQISSRLGWRPQVGLEEGVKVLLDNIDNWREAPVWTPEKISLATKDWFQFLGKAGAVE